MSFIPGQNTAKVMKGGDAELKGIGFAVPTTYSVTGAGQTKTIDASLGTNFIIDSTTTDAYTLAAPTNMFKGQEIVIQFKNSSGGVMGTPTFNAVFKTASFTKPANGYNRSLRFRYDGTNWRQQMEATDVAN